MSHVLHNPKAYAPAVYIPAWLSQVPTTEVSASSKLVYGRLAQWATAQGKAHRSAPQLSQELGLSTRTVERCIKELRKKLLIGSYQQVDGGHNHYEFYDHPWMHEEINKNLCYKSDNIPPPDILSAPPDILSAPPDKSAVHKIKEIKGNKITTTTEPEVVVVEINSKTLTATEKQKLSDVFKSHPIETPNIKSLDDFLSAALHSILNRGPHINRMQRLHGIIKLMKTNSFEEPPLWKNQCKDEESSEQRARRLWEERQNQRRKAGLID